VSRTIVGLIGKRPAFTLLGGAMMVLFCASVGRSDTGNGTTASLQWTAPGDDGNNGTAFRYDLRYSLKPISAENFIYATPVSGLPSPARAGTRQYVTVTGLAANTEYYFALKTVDRSGNWSGLSNVAVRPGSVSNATLPPPPFAFLPPQPNPAWNTSSMRLSMPRRTNVRIDVFDAGGRLVKTLADGSYPAGPTDLQWDLRDKDGVALVAGRYWIRAALGSDRILRTISILR
jgi:FlgD Ig-like domain/Fibronectin type III domain